METLAPSSGDFPTGPAAFTVTRRNAHTLAARADGVGVGVRRKLIQQVRR
jgi:hypothetical protein